MARRGISVRGVNQISIEIRLKKKYLLGGKSKKAKIPDNGSSGAGKKTLHPPVGIRCVPRRRNH